LTHDVVLLEKTHAVVAVLSREVWSIWTYNQLLNVVFTFISV